MRRRLSLVLPCCTLARTISYRPFCTASAICCMLSIGKKFQALFMILRERLQNEQKIYLLVKTLFPKVKLPKKSVHSWWIEKVNNWESSVIGMAPQNYQIPAEFQELNTFSGNFPLYTPSLDENRAGGILYTASWICSKPPCANFVPGHYRYKIRIWTSHGPLQNLYRAFTVQNSILHWMVTARYTICTGPLLDMITN